MKKKTCIIAAALAAFFMLPFFGLTAYATELDETPEDLIVGEEMPDTEIAEIDEFPDFEEYPDAPVTDYPETPPKPFTPDGTGTVIDNATNEDGKEFYTIMTPDEHVFYLVIDKQRNTDNVYFLNAVTIADLAALAELPEFEIPGVVAMPEPIDTTPEQPEVPPETEQTNSNSNMGMYVAVGVIVALGGAAGWYFKIYRPKQQGAANGDEYEPPTDDNDNSYADGWGDASEDNIDSPLWGDNEESGDTDD